MLTKITKGLFQGKHLNDIERDMADHRQLNARKKNRANNTKPPRTRDGQTYPGGKAMRKALKKLAMRRKMREEHISASKSATAANTWANIPGSMQP